jgi:hypothetical protein
MRMKKSGIKYPSARLKGLEEFMAFVQEPDWRPSPINIDLFRRLGMAKGKEGLSIHALKFIGIINEDGIPTEEFENLKKDYQNTLKRLVQTSYAELFSLIPPKLANQARLVKFFGDPVETAEYQAKLFLWFCKQADIELPNVEERFHRARFDREKSK